MKETGQLGSVLTVFEIINTEDQEFTGIDYDLLRKSLDILVKEGKAAVYSASNVDESSVGVKFF